MESGHKSRSRYSGHIYITAFIILTILVVFIKFAYYQMVLHLYNEPAGPGLFGDMFGGLNALFSGLALAGVITAIFMQHHELKLQQNEYRAAIREHQMMRRQYLRNAQVGFSGEQEMQTQYTLINTGRAGTQVEIRSLDQNISEEKTVARWESNESLVLPYREKITKDRLEIIYFDDLGFKRKCIVTISSTADPYPDNPFHQLLDEAPL